jgi:hypothetical protein
MLEMSIGSIDDRVYALFSDIASNELEMLS